MRKKKDLCYCKSIILQFLKINESSKRNSYNSIATTIKMGKGLEYTFLQGGYTKKTHEDAPNHQLLGKWKSKP